MYRGLNVAAVSSAASKGLLYVRIVVTEPIHEDGIAILSAHKGAEVIAFETTATADELANVVPDADAILVRTIPLPIDLLAQATRLKIVSKHGVGCDNIPVDQLTARGLPVAIAADANATSVAEHTIMLMLACSRRLTEQDRETRNADWSYRGRVQGFELKGKTILIIGIGRIGQRVARLCQAFGMRIVGYDPYAGTDPHESVEALEKGLAQADIVTLHIPLGETSQMMLDRERLAIMKPGAVLINCARGGIVDEPALIDALESDHIAMYGADVFETEPVLASDPLLKRSDVIATLHTAAMTTESKRSMSVQAAENIIAALSGTLDPTVVFNRKELGL